MMFLVGLHPGLLLIAAIAGLVIGSPIAIVAGAYGLKLSKQHARGKQISTWLAAGIVTGAIAGAV